MTLVGGISVGGIPAFIGDLLISWRVPTTVDLPTRAVPSITPGLDDYFASSLEQKLVLIRPYFLLAWAGSRPNANRIIQSLDAILPEKAELADAHAALQLLDTCDEDGELLAIVISDGTVQPYCARTRGFELDGRRIYLMGSGRGGFFNYLEAHPDLVAGQETADGILARTIALRFGSRAMALQWVVGTGLEQSWGGGFEVAYPEPDGFRKCDRLLFRAWKIEADGSYVNSGRSFFNRYYGRDLYLSCFNPEEKTYVIRSPVGETVTPPAYERCTPSWTVDLLVHEPTGMFIEAVRFHPDHRPVADFVEFVDGALTGWSMDQAYVDQLVASAIARIDQGNRFTLSRY